MSKFDRETKRNDFFAQRDRQTDALVDLKTGKVFKNLVVLVDCPLCNSKRFSVLFSKNGFDFVRCKKCSLVYVNPQLQEEKMIDYYNDSSLSNDLAIKFIASPKQQEVNRELYNLLYDRAEKAWGKKKLKQKRKVLDIGCSVGLFVKMGQDRGYDALGLELNEKAAQYAEKKFKVKVERKLLHECKFPANSFDIISMFGVIEHLAEPVEVMREVARILKPGGFFVGICPNIDSLVCMTLHEKSRTFSGRIHLSYFSPKTLDELFKKVGLKKSNIETVWTGKDSLLNYFQFLDPFGDEEYSHLPEKFKKFILDKKNFAKIEKKMSELGIGLKLRFMARK